MLYVGGVGVRGLSYSRRRRRRAWLGAAASFAAISLGIPLARAADAAADTRQVVTPGLVGGLGGGRLHGAWLVLIIVGAVALVCAVAALTYLHVGAHHAAAGHGHRGRGARAPGTATHWFCPSCGVRLDADERFCRNCGRHV